MPFAHDMRYTPIRWPIATRVGVGRLLGASFFWIVVSMGPGGSFSMGNPIVPSNYTFINTAIGGSNTTTAAGAQTGWLFTGGSNSVNAAHWSYLSFYYLGYVFDGSYTFNTTTGIWSGTNNASAFHGYLSSGANDVIVTIRYDSAQSVGMMRFYPAGRNEHLGTDYAVSYRDGADLRPLITRQASPGAGDVQTFRDYTFAPVVTQELQISLFGQGGWDDNATFGEIQTFIAAPGNLFWGPGAGGGGSGTWSSVDANWAASAGLQGGSTQTAQGTLVFGDTAGTVTVSGSVGTTAGMKFASTGYEITGGAQVELAGYSPTVNTITTDAGVTATINSSLSGTGGFNKEGSGTLRLGGANVYTGTAVISAGHLVGSAASLRDAIANYGAVTFNQTASGTFSGAVTGTGTFTKEGPGTLTLELSGTRTFTTGITIAEGGLELGGSGVLAGTTFSQAIVNNGTLFYTSSAAQTLSGAISGTGGLVKQGGGRLTLSANNTYGGMTEIQGGELSIASLPNPGVAGPTGTNARIAISNSGTLSYTGGSVTTSRTLDLAGGVAGINVSSNATLTISGSVRNSGSLAKSGIGTLVLSASNDYAGGTSIRGGTLRVGAGGTTGWIQGDVVNDAAFAFDRSDDIVFAGLISGSGSLTKSGSGSLTLTGSNSYAGGTTITGGSLLLGHASALGVADAMTINSGTLDLRGYSLAINSLSGNSTGRITSGSAGAITLTSTAETNTTYAGTIVDGVGTISFVKSGSATLTLSGSNTYSGNTTISSGTLQVGAGSTTGSVSGNIANAGGLIFNRSNAMTYSGTINGAGSVTKTGAGALTLTGSNSYTGGTTISGGTIQLGAGGTDGWIGGSIVNNGDLVFNRSDNVTYADPISGTGELTKSGSGRLTLSASNAYSGGTTINSGVLVQGVENALGGLGTMTVTSGTLDLNGWSATVGALRGSGLITTGSAAAIILTTTAATTGTYAGRIEDGTGTISLAKRGNSTLVLSGSNSHSGVTTVFTGSLALGDLDALRFSTLDTGTSGPQAVTFVVAGTNTYSLGGLQGADTLAIGVNTISVGRNGLSTTFSGTISGTGGLTKVGSGTLILTGSSTYIGPTTASAGRLEVNGSLGNTAVTVQNAAELGGSGSLAGSLAVLAGGTLAPGNSIASLATGTTSFAAASTFAYEVDSSLTGSLGTAADLLVVNGGLSIAPGSLLTLTDITGGAPQRFAQDSTVFAMINYSGTWDGGLFTYNGTQLIDSGTFVAGGQPWRIDYDYTYNTASPSTIRPLNYQGDYVPSSGTQKFVAITAVPEPSAWAMGLAGIACGGWVTLHLRRRA